MEGDHPYESSEKADKLNHSSPNVDLCIQKTGISDGELSHRNPYSYRGKLNGRVRGLLCLPPWCRNAIRQIPEERVTLKKWQKTKMR